MTVTGTGNLTITAGFGQIVGNVAFGGAAGFNGGTITGTLAVSAGTFTISGGGSVTGDTTVSGGTLVTNADALAAAVTVTVSGTGTFTSSGTDSFTAITQTGGTIDGSGVLTLSGAFTQSGGATGGSVGISAATFTQSGGATLAAGTSVTSTGVQTLQGGTIAGTLNGMGAITSSGATSVTGTIANAASLTVTGGTLTLAGDVTVTGATTVSGGTLTIGNGGAAGTLATTAIVNNAALVFNRTGGLNVNQAISGTGTVTVLGGSVSLSGTNTYTGMTTLTAGTLSLNGGAAIADTAAVTVNGGTLQVNANETIGSLAGTGGIVSLAESRVLTVGAANTSTSYAGVIQGTNAGLTKTGTGTLTLTGTNTYTGATTINGGTLIVNGSIASSSGVTIAAGATLGGTGQLPALTVNGVLSPGNSVGTIRVAGLTLGAGATTVIEFEGATADLIQVTGAATLAGALRLVPLGGTYLFGTPYTILTATGGRSGQFATVSTTGSFGVGVTTAVIYNPANVQVTLTAAPLVTAAGAAGAAAAGGAAGVTIASPSGVVTVIPNQAPVLGARTRNVTAVAAGLDRALFSGADLSSLFGVYNQPTREALAAAVNTLSGEVHTAASAIGFRASDRFLRAMLDPAAAGRGGGLTGSGFAGFTADLPGRKGPVDAPAPMRIEPNYRVWGALFGGVERVRGDAVVGSARRETRDLDLAVGADFRVAPGSVAGFALSGGQARARLAGNLGSAEADIFQAGVYGATRLGRFGLAAAGSYAALDVETRRAIPALGQSPRADYRVDVWSGRLQAEYSLLSHAGLTLSPIAALQAQAARLPGFAESNALTGAAVGVVSTGRTNTTLRSELGLRAEVDTLIANRKVAVFAQAAWGRYALNQARFAASIAGIANSGFLIEGARSDRDAALVSTGLDIHLAPNVVLSGRFDAEASRNARDYAGNAALRVTF